MPGRARVHYNLALALQQLGRHPKGEAELLEARRLAPGDAGIVQAITVLYIQQERWKEALPQARALVALTPDAIQALQLVRRIEAELASRPRVEGERAAP
jgi:predicted Zn-dependent protease